jgi:hypothetical protein
MSETSQTRVEPLEDYSIGPEAMRLEGPSTDEDLIVPVRIVETGRAREINRHRLYNVPVPAGTVTADGKITQVAGPNRNRTRMRIYNTHAADAVRLLDDGGQSSFTGFILAAGKDVDLFTEQEVYAVVPLPGVNVVTLSVVDEFSLPEA